MEIIVVIFFISSFLLFLYLSAQIDYWKNKAEGYERIMDQLLPEINKFQQILDDDMDRKVERLKKLQSLSWKELEYENTRKN